MGEWIAKWWATQPNEVRAAVIGAIAAAVISVLVGVSAWLLFGIPKMIAWHYKQVLMDLDETKARMKSEIQKKSGSTSVVIPEEECVRKSGHWRCTVRRAQRWEKINNRFHKH